MLSDTVGERITTWRKRRGWNREKLAEECARLGMPELTHASLTNIESGRRSDGVRRRMVTVDELAVIGQALDVPPILLLAPYPDHVGVDLFPNTTVPSYMVITWFSGESVLPDDIVPGCEKSAINDENWFGAASPVQFVREHGELLEARAYHGFELVEAMRAEEAATTPEERKIAATRKESHLINIGHIDAELVKLRGYMHELEYPEMIWPPVLDYLKNMTNQDFERNPINPVNRKVFDNYKATVIAAELGEERESE